MNQELVGDILALLHDIQSARKASIGGTMHYAPQLCCERVDKLETAVRLYQSFRAMAQTIEEWEEGDRSNDMDGESFLILWLGTDEYEEVNGPLEAVIAEVKRDDRYRNYGRTGAIIVRAERLYEIRTGIIERTFV